MPDYTNNWCFEKKKHLDRLNHFTIYDILTYVFPLLASHDRRNFWNHWGAGNSPALHASRASSLCNGALAFTVRRSIWFFSNTNLVAPPCQRKVSKTHGFTGCFCFSVDILVSSILNIHPEAWGFMIQFKRKNYSNRLVQPTTSCFCFNVGFMENITASSWGELRVESGPKYQTPKGETI